MCRFCVQCTESNGLDKRFLAQENITWPCNFCEGFCQEFKRENETVFGKCCNERCDKVSTLSVTKDPKSLCNCGKRALGSMGCSIRYIVKHNDETFPKSDMVCCEYCKHMAFIGYPQKNSVSYASYELPYVKLSFKPKAVPEGTSTSAPILYSGKEFGYVTPVKGQTGSFMYAGHYGCMQRCPKLRMHQAISKRRKREVKTLGNSATIEFDLYKFSDDKSIFIKDLDTRLVYNVNAKDLIRDGTYKELHRDYYHNKEIFIIK